MNYNNLKNRHIQISLLAFFLCIFNASGQQVKTVNPSKEKLWQELAPYFTPPSKYQNNYGDYRSPLKFYDGREVKNQTDWKKRRQEILATWTAMMGKWPPFIENQKPEIVRDTIIGNYTRYKIKFNWLPGQKTDGYLLIPDGKEKRPAVITVYYEPETSAGIGDKEYRDFAHQLALRGFVTLSIGTTETTNSKTYSLYYPDIENSEIQPLSVLAYAAANSWFMLSQLPEVDQSRIGITGHSYGGKWAMFASCLFEKFACAVWSDPGIVFDDSRPNVNYWEPWYLGYYPPPWNNTWRKTGKVEGARGLYPFLREKGYDLHELHTLMAPRPFLVSGGSEDGPARWIPLNHSIAVNRLLGSEYRVGMTNRPDHSPNSESNNILYEFFEYYLK
jgi:hypothetical protein